MKNLILVVLSVISAVTCNEFTVLSSPKSIEFKGDSELPSESLSEVLAATLGYSIQSTKIWDGLFVNDPFNTAKSVVSIVVEGAEGLSFKNSKTFILAGDEINFEDALLNKVLDHSHVAIDLDLVDKVDEEVMTPFGELKKTKFDFDVKFLKPKSNKNDKEFLNQITYLRSLVPLFSEAKAPAALNVRVSMKMLSSQPAINEATKLLAATIEKLNAAVSKDGNTVFAVITVAEHHSRSKRQVVEPNNTYNLAELTSKNYPVVFNIMFWFTIIFVFALIAISLALSNVEDRDSIIYRMTGARGKKDN